MAGVDQIVGWASTALVAMGGGKFVLDLFLSRGQNRKASAEGDAILINSAGTYVKQLTDDLTQQRREFDEYRREQDNRDRRRAAALAAHASWDGQVWRKLYELGVDIPPPPPVDIETQESA